MQIIEGPSQNKKLSRMAAVSHAAKISFSAGAGDAGPGGTSSSSHCPEQEPWEVQGTQLPPDLPASPRICPGI